METKKKFIPAPIDNKNVDTDWIETIFDNQSCVWGEKKSVVGYINGEPVIANWTGNRLMWKFVEQDFIDGSDHLAVLKDRLKDAHDPDGDLIEEFMVIGNRLWQSFYWKNED